MMTSKLKSTVRDAMATFLSTRGRSSTRSLLLERFTNKNPPAVHAFSEPFFKWVFNKQDAEKFSICAKSPFICSAKQTIESKLQKLSPNMGQCLRTENFESSVDPFRIMKEHVNQRMQSGVASTPSSCKLVVLGGPGAGKGSYAPFLCSWLGISHISTGDLVRQELSRPASSCSTAGESMLREAVRASMNEGKLLDDSIILELLANRLREMNPNVGFMLDGFPRTINQAHILEDLVHGIDMALNFRLEDDMLLAKCLGRRVCSECGKSYNLTHVDFLTHEHTAEGVFQQKRVFFPAHLPPSECASKLKVRGDDSSEAAVRERLRLHARCWDKPRS